LQIGVDWKQKVAELEEEKGLLEELYGKMSRKLTLPDYYLKPFHAYEEGNLSWQAAMEVDPAALTVHALVYTPSNKKDFRRDGDFNLRDYFHQNVKRVFAEKRFSPKRIVDMGCSTGLSTLKLHESFPDAEIIGIDLSPYYLAGKLLAYIDIYVHESMPL
jgi:2-polyprenyl-3-methyl-5-hydroxy-6-metoxy-1,4-benzoquinol methylase